MIYDRQHSVFKQNLYPGNSQRAILKAFSGLTVTTIKDRFGKGLLCGLQTLSTAQKTILQLLDLEELHAKLQNSQ